MLTYALLLCCQVLVAADESRQLHQAECSPSHLIPCFKRLLVSDRSGNVSRLR